jgi:hypothetical protein
MASKQLNWLPSAHTFTRGHAELFTDPGPEGADFPGGLALDIVLRRRPSGRRAVVKGRPFGQEDRRDPNAEPVDDQFGRFLVDQRRAGRSCIEHHERRLVAGLHQFRGRLDRGQVEGAGAAGDEDQVGQARSLPRHGVGVGWGVDHGEVCAQLGRLGELAGQETRRPAIDDLGFPAAAPFAPAARRRLRVRVDDQGNAGLRRLSGQVDREGGLARPALLADDRDGLHVHLRTRGHVNRCSIRRQGSTAPVVEDRRFG